MATAQDTAARLTSKLRRQAAGWSFARRGGRMHLITPKGEYELRSPVVAPRDRPLMIVAKGALAGLVGTAMITVLMEGARSLLGQDLEQEQPLAMQPEPETRRTEPTEEMVQRIATGVVETEITPEQRRLYGTALHWLYGSFWGVLYGLTQTTLHVPAPIHGAFLGLTVWAFGPLTLFPAMRLTPPATGQPVSRNFVQASMHLIYGWTTAYTFRLLSRDPKA